MFYCYNTFADVYLDSRKTSFFTSNTIARTTIPSFPAKKKKSICLINGSRCYSVGVAAILVVVDAAMLKQLAANSTLRRTCATE